MQVNWQPFPTFVIGGAPRSGTTFIYHLLDHHPEIFLAKPRAPEPKFFLVDEEYAKGLEYYSARFFSPGAKFAIRGEKSANYLESAEVPIRIHRHFPAIKLIFVLRDPVERAFSNYLWSTRNGHETLGFAQAVELESVRENSYAPQVRFARPYSYVSRGMYATLLKRFWNLFPPEQIKIVLHDDIVSRPESLVADLMQFVGAPVVLPPIPICRGNGVNTSLKTGRKQRSSSRLMKCDPELCRVYAEPNQELASLIGRDLSHWCQC